MSETYLNKPGLDTLVAEIKEKFQKKISGGTTIPSDSVVDTNCDNKFVTAAEKAQITTNANNITTLDGRITTAEGDIDTIEGKIPSEATSSNKLADKNFVNSSIATATATFRGSYDVVKDLSLTTSATESDIATALATAVTGEDNNDYAFVIFPTAPYNEYEDYTSFTSVDDYVGYYVISSSTYTLVTSSNKSSLGITAGTTKAYTPSILKIDRYKYNGTAWSFEYTLNNSGFTASQWAAINSGITDTILSDLQNNKLDKSGGVMTGSVDFPKGHGVRFKTDSDTKYLLYGNASSTDAVYVQIKDSSDIVTNYCKLIDNTGKLYSANDEVQTISKLVTSFGTTPSDSKYPSEKLVYDQLGTKQATITGAASTITSSDLTASRALVSNASGKVAVSDITATELGYLDNVTSNIQTQLNAKQAALTAGSNITISTIGDVLTISAENGVEILPADSVLWNLDAGIYQVPANTRIYSYGTTEFSPYDSETRFIFVGEAKGTPTLWKRIEMLAGYILYTFDLSASRTNNDNTVDLRSLLRTYVQGSTLWDTTPTQNSTKPVTSGGIYTALSGKQDSLTFDDAPTASSSNPVKSGGVYTALGNKVSTSDYIAQLTVSDYFYTETSGYTSYTTTSDYVGHYVRGSTDYTLVNDSNKNSLDIVPGTTKAYDSF